MYRVILCAALVLLALRMAVAPAFADDADTCRNGTGDEAIAACSRVIQRNPRDAVAYANRGAAYNNKKGEYDRTIADYSQAIRLDPKYPLAYANRCWAYNRKNEYDRAIADCDQAIRLDPKLAVAYNNRCWAYSGKNEYDRAIADCDQAIRLDPKYANAYLSRCAAYYGKIEYDRAIADCGQVIRLDPKYALAYHNRGIAYRAKGEYDRAITDLDQAIRLDPKNANAYNNRGFAHHGKGEYDRAIADYDQAIGLNPFHLVARQNRERAQAALSSQPTTGKPPALAQASAQPTKRALVIGIDTYPNLGRAAQLERAVADAEAVGDRLAALGFQVTRLTAARHSTLDALLRGFEAFRKTVAPNDMVVLFYAGHGMGLSDGTYLLPADVNEASLEVEATARRVAINENEFTNGLRQARAAWVCGVSAACRHDLFSRALGRTLGNGRGLRPAETEGIFKLYSASEGQTALDRLPGNDGSKNSVFTRVFLKALGTPGLNLSALGTTVRGEVHELSRSADHAQTPAVYDKLIGSTRVFLATETAVAGTPTGGGSGR